MCAQEDELVSRLRELNRTAAAASVKRLSQANGDPALDVRHVIALSNEELERVIAEARRLQPLTGVQRESVRLLVENCRLALTANDYAEGGASPALCPCVRAFESGMLQVSSRKRSASCLLPEAPLAAAQSAMSLGRRAKAAASAGCAPSGSSWL